MKRRPQRARENHKAGDPSAKPVCCKKETEMAPQEACKIDPKEQNAFIAKQEERNARKRAANRRRHRSPDKGIYPPRPMTWKDKHCGTVMFNYNNPASLREGVDIIKEELNRLKSELHETMEDIAKDTVQKRIKRTIEVQGCAVIGGLIGGALGFFFGGVGAMAGVAAGAEAGEALCGAAATAEGAVDAVTSAKEALDVEERIRNAIQKNVKKVKSIEALAVRAEEIAKLKALGQSQLTSRQKELLERLQKEQKDAKAALYAAQKQLTQEERCLRAKRCVLDGYNAHNRGQKSTTQKLSPKDRFFGLANPEGCCPGQTPHHIIPETKLKGCPGYQKGGSVHKQAPTVCLEGGKDNGTHGEMHQKTDEETKGILKLWREGKSTLDPESIDAAIEASARAYVATFGQCSQKCIKEQLERYYKKRFKTCKIRVVDKSGKVIERDNERDGDLEF